MSKYLTKKTEDFRIEGQFLGFAFGDGYKLKYLRLATEAGEQQIKVPKEQRSFLYRSLVPGVWVEVAGSQKLDPDKGTVKRKAYQVTPLGNREMRSIATDKPEASVSFSPNKPLIPTIAEKKSCILVCQKCKRGTAAVMNALETELDDRGLDQVTVKPTGCMKRCKEGPNMVMPDKTRYCKISPEQIPAVLDKHFPEAEPVCRFAAAETA
jgi:(2Fe-2S) ferredoxin